MAEVTLRGVSAAPGVVAGKAVVLRTFASDEIIDPARRPGELERARGALAAETGRLEGVARALRERNWTSDAEIVETGILMAGDPALWQRIEHLVLESGQTAPAAIAQATDEAAGVLAGLDDPTLAQRAADVRSLGRRAAAFAAGAEVGVGGVLIAPDLGPADVADLGLATLGAALAGGGVTAHAAIVARSLGIPMVVGIGEEVLDVEEGETVVLDADRGVVVRRPTAARVEAAREHGRRRAETREESRRRRDEPASTVDGHRVTVLVNAATTAEAVEGFEQGAEGIGLLRTELLFLDSSSWPSVKRQVDFLRPIFDTLAGRPATVRLFDFGADKTPPFLRGSDRRGIDLLLGSPDMLRHQLAAILEAARGADVRILVPMVTGADQLHTVRQALPAPARVGAMIETPEAARGAEAIAAASDFFSIGTNDLTQLVLGLDRERSKTAPVLDPRVLGLIDRTVRAAHAAGIQVDVCGEAASDAMAAPVLVGLGVDELSVAAARVGTVRQWVRELDYARARSDAERLLDEARHAGGERV